MKKKMCNRKKEGNANEKKIIMLYHVTDSNDQCNHIHKQCRKQQPNGTQVNQSRKKKIGIKYSAYLTEDGKESWIYQIKLSKRSQN